ncbi:TetR/AcrR family transcriptional regulator [Rhizobium sp.]|jgi:AcrR family transcriptional regulator|uniref:TetR/AcrR family transcriptional regulator n=1 Tax=Rhizobium sp. TaxID=391 RepID=UPI000E945709|nr:TetR family transcriptional regulator [Rhizobium sp.]
MAESRKVTSSPVATPIRTIQTSKQHFELKINGRTIRSAETSQVAILEAATEEFATHGFCGARVDTIALRAKTNKRMLYHYFTDKSGLYVAVLERVFEKILVAENGLNLSSKEPIEGLRELVLFLWNYFLSHQEFVLILSSENQLKAQYIKQSKKIPLIHAHFAEGLSDVIRRGCEKGVFRADVDPVQIHLTILSMSFYYINNQHTIAVNFKQDLFSPEMVQSWGEHMVATTLAAVMFPGVATPGG